MCVYIYIYMTCAGAGEFSKAQCRKEDRPHWFCKEVFCQKPSGFDKQPSREKLCGVIGMTVLDHAWCVFTRHAVLSLYVPDLEEPGFEDLQRQRMFAVSAPR